MAEGSYYDYHGGLGHSNIPHMPNFGGRPDSSNYDGDHKSTGPGFYTEQFPSVTGQLSAPEMMPGPHHPEHDMAHMMMAPAADPMYEAHYRGYMKPEKGMPPTPPGSPEEPKLVPGVGGCLQPGPPNSVPGPSGSMDPMSAMQQHYLAKPVPMRRLSEKRIAEARACISSVTSAMVATDPLNESGFATPNPALARALASVQHTQKRPRGEKKPIPVEAKDEKYFERRKRNNTAAKKSRDARKCREDEIAIRASYLEKENAVLRAQVATLREEANSLRQMLVQKRPRP